MINHSPYTQSRKLVVLAMLDSFQELGSYGKVGKKFGVNKGIVWQLCNDPDYLPGKKIRKKLGIKSDYEQHNIVCRDAEEKKKLLEHREFIRSLE